jgi:F-type H+-transporting ATPase subunit b
MIMQVSDMLLNGAGSMLANASHSGGGIAVDIDKSVLIQFAAFILLFLMIKPLLLDPFLKVIEERERRTDGAKAEARAMDERAGEIIERYEAELDKVRRIASQERERLRSEGQKLEAQMLQEARQQTTEIVREGKQRISKEASSIQFELGRSSAGLGADIASRVLGREVRE